MEIDITPILDELRIIRQELEEIKKSMPDKEMFLSPEECRQLDESYKNEKGLVTSKDMRKVLGI